MTCPTGDMQLSFRYGTIGTLMPVRRYASSRNAAANISLCSRACCSTRRAPSLNCPLKKSRTSAMRASTWAGMFSYISTANMCTVAVEFHAHRLAQGPIAMFEGNVSPGNQLGIVRRHSLERTRDLRTVRSNLLPRSLGHVPLVLDQLTVKVLLQTDQSAFSVHPSPHKTRHFQDSLRVLEALIVCVNILGRQSGPPPVAQTKTETQSIPAVHCGCRLHQRTQPARWHESASRGGRRTLRGVSNAGAHV